MTSHEQQKQSEGKSFKYIGLKNKLQLFCTGFLQICLVSANTFLIARSIYFAIFILSFLIAFLWSYNIKKIAFGTLSDRLFYSLGAATGGVLGLCIIKIMF